MGIGFQGTLTNERVRDVTGSKAVTGNAVYASIDLDAPTSIVATNGRLVATPVDLAIGDLDCMFRHMPLKYTAGVPQGEPMLYKRGVDIVECLLGMVDSQLFGKNAGLLYKNDAIVTPLSVCLTLDSRQLAADHIRKEVAAARHRPERVALAPTDVLHIDDDSITINGRPAEVTIDLILATRGTARIIFNTYLARALIAHAAKYERFELTVSSASGIATVPTNHKLLTLLDYVNQQKQPGPCANVLDGPPTYYIEGDLKLRQYILLLHQATLLRDNATVLLFYNADADTLLTAELNATCPHLRVLWARGHKLTTAYRCLNLTQIRTTLTLKQIGVQHAPYDIMATFYFFLHFLYGGDYLPYEVSWPSRSPGLDLLTAGQFRSCVAVDPVAETVTLQLAGVHEFLCNWLQEPAVVPGAAINAKGKKLSAARCNQDARRENVYAALPVRLARTARVILYYTGIEAAGWAAPPPPFPPQVRALGRHTLPYSLTANDTWVIGSAPPEATTARPLIGICVSWEHLPPTVDIVDTEEALRRLNAMDAVVAEGVCVAYQPPTLSADKTLSVLLVPGGDNILTAHENATQQEFPTAVAELCITASDIVVVPYRQPTPIPSAPAPAQWPQPLRLPGMYASAAAAGEDCTWESDEDDYVPASKRRSPKQKNRARKRVHQTTSSKYRPGWRDPTQHNDDDEAAESSFLSMRVELVGVSNRPAPNLDGFM
jgi:hypothetical protein